jgi:outer membrane protein OmpA-like peptidoglycan-associated protein
MKTFSRSPILLAVALLLSACSSTPTTTSLLEQARADYRFAQDSAAISRYATLELKQAGEALAQANTAAAEHDSQEKIDQLAYIARQKIALTQEVGKQKSAEAEVAQSGKERDQMRLEDRTNEANAAGLRAQQAQASAQRAQGEAAEAKRVAQLAEEDTAQAQRITQEAVARAAQLEVLLNDLAAKKTERGFIITLGDVLFGTDLSRLNTDGQRTAQKLANILQQNPQRTVLVEVSPRTFQRLGIFTRTAKSTSGLPKHFLCLFPCAVDSS